MATFVATGSVLGIPTPGSPPIGPLGTAEPIVLVAPATEASTVTQGGPTSSGSDFSGVPGRWIGAVVAEPGAGTGTESASGRDRDRREDAVSPSPSPSAAPSPAASPKPSPRPTPSPTLPPPRPTPSPEPEPTRSPDPGDGGEVVCDFDWRAGPSEVEKLIRCAAEIWPVQGGPDKAVEVAKCESSLRPDAVGGDGLYLGIFQQHRDYWPARATRYGFDGVSALNGRANIIVSIRMASEGGWGPWSGCA